MAMVSNQPVSNLSCLSCVFRHNTHEEDGTIGTRRQARTGRLAESSSGRLFGLLMFGETRKKSRGILEWRLMAVVPSGLL